MRRQYAFDDPTWRRRSFKHGRFSLRARPGNRAARWRSVCSIFAIIFVLSGMVALVSGGWPLTILLWCMAALEIRDYHRGWPMKEGLSPMGVRFEQIRAKNGLEPLIDPEITEHWRRKHAENPRLRADLREKLSSEG